MTKPIVLTICVLAPFVAFVSNCHASELEGSILGGATSSVREEYEHVAVGTLVWNRHSHDNEGFQYSPMIAAGGLGSRDDRDGTHSDSVGFVGAGMQITREGWPIYFRVAAVYNNHDTSNLTGHFQFLSLISMTFFQRLELSVGHLSNAGIKKPNHGENLLLVGYHF